MEEDGSGWKLRLHFGILVFAQGVKDMVGGTCLLFLDRSTRLVSISFIRG